MRNYLLFIDTEASGLPQKWNLPYSDNSNWPYSVQISWLIYTAEGEEVKRENHYILNDNIEIEASAIKIHGITKKILQQKGQKREVVMEALASDLAKYNPLVLGHFMELDYHLLNADFYRAGIKSPLLHLPIFCTMLATTHFVRNPKCRYLRLAELYNMLFNRKLENEHNALVDAKATAECFFALLKRGDIKEEELECQKKEEEKLELFSVITVANLVILIVILFIALIVYLWSNDYNFLNK